MIIRSQDKKAITDDLKLYIRENDFICDKVKWEIRNAEQDLLATYSTEEKAVKVLDMICAGIMLECLIFQMPADEDVEV